MFNNAPISQKLSLQPPEFIWWLNASLGWTIREIVEYFNCASPEEGALEVDKKIEEAKERGLVTCRDNIFYFTDEDNSDLSIEQRISYFQNLQELHIQGQKDFTPQQLMTIKERINDLKKTSEDNLQEGADTIRIITFLLTDFFRISWNRIEKSIADMKINMAESVSNIIKDLDKDIDNDILDKIITSVGTMSTNFNIYDIFNEVVMSHPLIVEKINRYLEKMGQVKMVGGGAIHSDDSKTGGAQYKQKRKKKESMEGKKDTAWKSMFD